MLPVIERVLHITSLFPRLLLVCFWTFRKHNNSNNYSFSFYYVVWLFNRLTGLPCLVRRYYRHKTSMTAANCVLLSRDSKLTSLGTCRPLDCNRPLRLMLERHAMTMTIIVLTVITLYHHYHII